MKNKFTSKQKNLILNLFVFSILIFTGCVDFEEPAAIYDPSVTKTNDPVITSVDPAGIARGGVREIRINGQNLGVKGSDTDWVFIGGVRATIKEVIQTNAVIVYRPQLTEDNYDSPIQINITAPKAIDTSANIEYIVESPGGFIGTYSLITAAINGVDFDKDENIYVVSNRTVYRNDPTGNTLTTLLTSLPGAFRTISDVKFGPGESGLDLYLVNGTNIVSRVRVDTVA
ncbi:MAG: IPT/TIG domain-containing protein, partial [Ignavibacteria bacterium]